MINQQVLQARRKEILEIAARYGAHDVRIFGSVARGEQRENSDLDLVVRFEPERSLFDHAGLIIDLEELLGIQVDVVSERGLRERFQERVTNEAIPL
jgi:uncharacterized protein